MASPASAVSALAEGLREREHVTFPVVFNLHLNRFLDLSSIDIGEKGYTGAQLQTFCFRLRLLSGLIMARTYDPNKKREILEKMQKLEDTVDPSVVNKIGPRQAEEQWRALKAIMANFDYLMQSSNGTGFIPPLSVTGASFSFNHQYPPGDDYEKKPTDDDYRKSSTMATEADEQGRSDSPPSSVQSDS